MQLHCKIIIAFADDIGLINYSQTCIRQTPLGPFKKWSSEIGGCLIKHLNKTTTDKIWLFFAGFIVFISTVNV